MTKDGSFKKAVRRHAQDTGQRYTEALTDLEGLQARMFHQPIAERLLAHLRDHYGIDAIAATKASQHHDHVFRIDRRDGDPWIARVFPPARPRAGVEGDAAILRFLERHDYPAERLATDDAVSAFDGSTVLVTRVHPWRAAPFAGCRTPRASRSSPSWVTCSDGCMPCHSTSPSAAPVGRAGMIPGVRAARVRT